MSRRVQRKHPLPQPNDKFGRLVIIREVPSTTRDRFYLCRCICGTEKVVRFHSLVSGKTPTRSCGCARKENAAIAVRATKTTHGLRRSPEYGVWANMKNRTTNPKCPEYSYYGGAGVNVCSEWVKSFAAFYNYIGPRPTPDHEIDRYPDPNGNYEPGNVRWATKVEQMLNRRNAAFLTAFDKTLRLTEWAAVMGISVSTIYRRRKRGLQGEALLFGGRYRAKAQRT